MYIYIYVCMYVCITTELSVCTSNNLRWLNEQVLRLYHF